ncbi:hypothetical protein NE237_027617 [Protea cynaroides]|uniref:Uncharacterized protein n=1 Tax=Protea cynaroides TaxID=273540 RepID=A0A9Q0GQU5_9MAGN|nr:hypothetical protein NE237_027617 [Protea cynaroides]
MVSLFIIVSQLMILSTVGDVGDAGADPGPIPVERAVNFITPLEKLTSLIKLARDRLRIPDSERIKAGGSNAGEFITNAAVKSFEETEEIAERSAKAAVDAVHETAKKLKRLKTKQHNDI